MGRKVGTIGVVRRIAVGGMGEVFEGFDESLGRRVALKAIRADRASLGGRVRLRREARILSQLSDPRICTIHGWLEAPEGDFLVLEFIEGATLEGSPKLPVAEALRIGSDLAEVLAAAHQQGVVHRDLKPSNVMVTPARQVKVLDFGVSSVTHDELDQDPEPSDGFATRAGALVGTPAYMSPEQARGERASPASDIYALGLLLAQLLTGTTPASRTPDPDQLLALRREGSAPIDLGALPRALRPLIAAMTARAPEARPPAAVVVDQLAAIRDAPRRRLQRLAAAAAVVAAVVLGLLHTSRLTRERNLAREAEREAEQVVAFLESMFETTGPRRKQNAEVTARELVVRGAERIRHELSDQPDARARLLQSIGQVAMQLGALEQADELLGEALALREQLEGRDSPELIPLIDYLARLRVEQSLPQEGLAYAERALALAAATSDPLLIARRRAESGVILSELAQHDEALTIVQQALDVVDTHPEAPAELERRVVYVFANSLRRSGKLDEAVVQYERVEQLDSTANAGLFDRGNALYNHGITLSQLGRWAEAEPLLEQAGELWRQAYGEVNHEVAKVENALAIVDREEKRYDRAEQRFRQAVAIWRETLGPDAINVGHGLNNLANLFMRQERMAEAEPFYREALAIFEQRLGEDHPNTSMALINLARGLSALGRYSEAVALGSRAVAIDERLGGEENPDLGWDLMLLAQIRWRHQPSEEARAMAERGRRIVSATVGADHPELATIIAETPELFAEKE